VTNIVLVSEEGLLGGDAENWTALHSEMLESEICTMGLDIQSSTVGRGAIDDVERCTESDGREKGEDVHSATAARNDRQHDSSIRAESRSGSVFLSKYSARTDTAGMIGGFQQYALNGTHQNAHGTARPTFPLSGKRRGVALPNLPSRGLGIKVDQASCLKKDPLSRPSYSQRATQKRRSQRPPSVSPLPEVRLRSVSHELPSGPDKGQQTVEKEVVWEYRHLLDYRIVDGQSLVLVPWLPTWEPADEYPSEEVDRVRRHSRRQIQIRRRGRPRSK
jgi:hypothetical protein